MNKTILICLFTCFLTASLLAQDIEKLNEALSRVEEVIFESTELGQTRQVLVYTPNHYAYSPFSYYNVIYVLDGQDSELFYAANGIAHLLTNGSQKFIVVGIKATYIEEQMYTRNHDLLPSDTQVNLGPKSGGNAEAFLAYIKNEVVPYIESNYRTLTHRTAVGHSLGGSFLVYSLLHQPDLFDNYIAISPNLEYDNQRLVRGLENFDPRKFTATKYLYMSHANEHLHWPDWKPANEKAHRILRDSLNSKNFRTVTESYPEEGHRTGFVPAFTSAMRTYLDSIQPKQEMELSREQYEVTFRIKVTNEDDEVYITGNQESLGNWQPNQVRMQKAGPLERSVTLQVQDPVKVQFTHGDWDSQVWIKVGGGGFSNQKLTVRPEEGKEYLFEKHDGF